MKKLKPTLIVIFSLLLLVFTLYLLVDLPSATEGLESNHTDEGEIFGYGRRLIGGMLFHS